MACVNISGRLYPVETWNMTDLDDSSEWTPMLDVLNGVGTGSSGIGSVWNIGIGFNLSSSARPGFKTEIYRDIVCMSSPKKILEQWEIDKNLAMLISYSVIFVIGVLGNVTAMMGMIGDRKSRNATTLFLVSLSAADLLLLLVCAPLEVLQYFVIQWDDSGTICKTAKYAEVLSAVASVLNLTAVSLERFIVIVFPIRSRSVCTMSNCRRAVLVVWIVSLLLTAPVLFTKGTNPLTFTDGEESVTVNYCVETDGGVGLIFAIYQAVILLLAPGLVMIICYTYVIRELWLSTRNMRVLTNTNTNQERRPRQQERRWRGGTNTRWPYNKKSSDAASSSVPKAVATTATGTTIITGTTTPVPSTSTPLLVRGHEACLLPCHGPCSASNQASSCCNTFTGTANNGHNSPNQSSPENSPHHQAHLLLARKPLRETLRTRPTIRKIGVHQARAEDARNARKQVIKMLILVIVLFLICWGSRICMEISIKVGLESFSQGIYFLRVVINMLPYVHSCLNPFIYSLMSKNFRRSMWRRIHSCCCCMCANSACCTQRRCFCHPSAAFSSMARTGQDGTTYGDRSPGGQRRSCRHCRQFNSQYNLNDLSVGMGAGTSLNAPQERTEASGSSRMRGLTSRLAKGSNGAIGGSSPLLLMRTRSVNNRSVCSTSVIPECTEHFEVDCCL
ncbi:cholecystokinin receptor type A [Daphnia magna]|uniref:cholecystokinin receptor type A n=1 Tax=Daphnia magna TaxID=35525 RepID=UPI001E1BD77F|nr:cholecystokinin receptor type A [Daphnia magna]